MAEIASCPALEPASIQKAYEKIKNHIHKTPLLTSRSLNAIASHPDPAAFQSPSPPPLQSADESATSTAIGTDTSKVLATPKFNLFFKCENQQKIGAFKARGAFHAITHLIETLGIDTLRNRGVTTHSSGNHAQALALAAHTFNVPSYIVMPTISTPSKIAGTQMYTDNVIFSGSTSDEREAKVEEVIKETGAILVPPYDHPDIIVRVTPSVIAGFGGSILTDPFDVQLGQGTAAFEMESQFQELQGHPSARFDAVLTPLGGGGLLSGTATWFSHTSTPPANPPAGSESTQSHTAVPTLVFGTEPSFSGANDAQLGLARTPPTRIAHVKSLTIADGLRTPVGLIPWTIIRDKSKVRSVYSASETEIKHALRFMLERAKIFVEPSSVVPLAVLLFCQEFRDMVAEAQATEARDTGKDVRPWNVGIILSGGNTTVEALAKLFAQTGTNEHGHGAVANGQRETGTVGLDGSTKVEDVAG